MVAASGKASHQRVKRLVFSRAGAACRSAPVGRFIVDDKIITPKKVDNVLPATE